MPTASKRAITRSGLRDYQASQRRRATKADFDRIATAALLQLPALLERWLPEGRREGQEWVCRNPKRNDRWPGSFKVNLATGRWADFATDDRGGDAISLAAYLFDLSQAQAAGCLAEMLGIDEGARP